MIPKLEERQAMTLPIRDAPPAHYTFKIQSFSLLSKNLEKYESNVFESGGFKWKLLLYPKGDEKMLVTDHISLYLQLTETDSFPPGWAVIATCRLFLFDEIRGKYVIFEENGGEDIRFHLPKTTWGYSELIPWSTFIDPSNGYLVNNTCVFGAEVFVRNTTGEGECLSMIDDPITYSHTWRVQKFSKLKKESVFSEPFLIGNYRCKIQLYPKGEPSQENNKFLSLYLKLDDFAFHLHEKLYVEFILSIKDQKSEKHVTLKRMVKNDRGWFSESERQLGFPKVIEISSLKNRQNGFVVKDSIVIKAELTILGSVKSFTVNDIMPPTLAATLRPDQRGAAPTLQCENTKRKKWGPFQIAWPLCLRRMRSN